MHVAATVRFTELKISREGIIAPGEEVEKGCSSGRDLQYSSACRALKRPKIISLRREFVASGSQGVLT